MSNNNNVHSLRIYLDSDINNNNNNNNSNKFLINDLTVFVNYQI